MKTPEYYSASEVYFSENDKFHRNLQLIPITVLTITFVIVVLLKMCTNIEVRISLIYFLFFGLLLFSTEFYLKNYQNRYKITLEYLEILIGPILQKSIRIKDIVEVRSKNKSQVIYGNSFSIISIILKNSKEINISPKNKDLMIESLLRVNKNIVIH